MAEHGNMSSVTVLFVLEETLRQGRPAPASAAPWARSVPVSAPS
jgi:predicted naringenin-chalcone synthase